MLKKHKKLLKLTKEAITNKKPNEYKSNKQNNQLLDERFQQIIYDPRFKKLNNKTIKTKVDERFAHMFTDDRFKVVSQVDKYGRQIQKKEGRNQELDELYYDKSSSENEDQQEQINSDSQFDNLSNSQSESKELQKDLNIKEQIDNQIEDNSNDDDENPIGEKIKLKKGQKVNIQNKQKNNKNRKQEEQNEKLKDPFANGTFQWDEVSSSDEDIQYEIEQDDDLWEDKQDKIIEIKETTSRLALCNYDWMNISAQDLMILFHSFKQKSGIIKKITVYPSNYGLEKLKEEEQHGPVSIWKENKNLEVQNENQQDNIEGYQNNKIENQNEINKKQEEKKIAQPQRPIIKLNNQIIIKENNENTEIDINKLRRYEKDRLKYYYAIIECDSKETAEFIYDSCQGKEFEQTNLPIDLSFVQDTVEFTNPSKEICDSLPALGQVKNFVNRSIGHTDVKLTWEEPNYSRFDFLNNKHLTDQQLQQVDWHNIIATDESSTDQESSQEKNNEINDMKQIKQQDEVNNWQNDFDKKNRHKNNEFDMQITFDQGFNNLGNKILEKQQLKDETPWQRYQRVRKEKKKQKRLLNQLKKEDNDYFFEPIVNQQEMQQKQSKKQIEKLERDKLSLLVDDEDVQRKQEFLLNSSDDRFNAIYSDPRFSIDPTNKLYKQDQSGNLLKEQMVRRKKRKLNDEQ